MWGRIEDAARESGGGPGRISSANELASQSSQEKYACVVKQRRKTEKLVREYLR